MIGETAYNSGHTATLRSAQISLWETSYVRNPLSEMPKPALKGRYKARTSGGDRNA